MAGMMQMVRLGRGEQDAVDARPEQAGEKRAAADAEAIENAGKGCFEIVQRLRSGVERGERIRQHDLAIKPGKMVAEERAHHDILVGLVAAHHHRPQRSLRRLAVDRHLERRKGQCRRVGEIARHQEAAGRQQAHRKALVAAGAKITREQLCGGQCRLLVLARFGLQRCKMAVPLGGKMCARRRARQRQALRRPLLKSFLQQRQVEQPLAGIVDDIERQGTVGAVVALVVDDEAQLADIDGRVRPEALLDQRAQMALISEARHRVVRLRRQMRARDPAGGIGLEHRKPAAARQAMDQRGDEYGLAGARQAGDAEPHRRVEEVLAIVDQRPGRQARLLDHILETECHMNMRDSNVRELGRAGPNRQNGLVTKVATA